MSTPTVSVVIPAFNGADFLGEAIQSVLDQTYPHFEIIVVDDVSQDSTPQIIKQCKDPRVKYVRHPRNLGAVAARHTGVRTSSGEIIALLDQDDLFHPRKLETHVAFLAKHPEAGVTYNARFEVRDSRKTVCGIWQPLPALTLADLVLGFPISPSDTVIRRSWAMHDGIWDDGFAFRGEHVIFNGQEIVFGGRLALAGCQFANVGRALNYRRYHSNRTLSKLSARCKAELACQQMIFSDPRCPDEILALQNQAFSNIYLIWAYHAFVQDETATGQELLREAIQLNPALLAGTPCELVKTLADTTASDLRKQPEALLHSVFDNLPSELKEISGHIEWAVARSSLLKGTRLVIWGQADDAQSSLALAAERGAEIDDYLVQTLTSELMDYETEFGFEACEEAVQRLAPHLEVVGKRRGVRQLKGNYWISRAFRSYSSGKYDTVAADVFRGIAVAPQYLTNRGVLSILLRSIYRRLR